MELAYPSLEVLQQNPKASLNSHSPLTNMSYVPDKSSIKSMLCIRWCVSDDFIIEEWHTSTIHHDHDPAIVLLCHHHLSFHSVFHSVARLSSVAPSPPSPSPRPSQGLYALRSMGGQKIFEVQPSPTPGRCGPGPLRPFLRGPTFGGLFTRVKF